MYQTTIRKGPVVTILTQSQNSSHRMQKFLQSMFQTKTIISDSPSSITNEMKQEKDVEDRHDELNRMFHPLFEYYSFNSSISICESSNTILHFLSIDENLKENSGASDNQNEKKNSTLDSNSNKKSSNSKERDLMTILAITPGPEAPIKDEGMVYNDYIQPTRDRISSKINYDGRKWNSQLFQSLKLASIKYSNVRDISILDLLSSELPILDFPTGIPIRGHEEHNTNVTSNKKFCLREIVLPFSDEATYSNGKSMLQVLSESHLLRPKIGLYQWGGDQVDSTSNQPTNGIILRPLPSAATDMILPPTTFIFQCHTLDDAEKYVQEQNQLNSLRVNVGGEEGSSTLASAPCKLTKLGFNGYQNNGQLRIESSEKNKIKNDYSSVNTSSLEFRYCDAKELSSSFAEAQESLLAGSLDDLQNVNVMVEGTDKKKNKNDKKIDDDASNSENESRIDLMNGLGDCWVEFRTNIKQPSGFFRKGGGRIIAKAPDLPFK